MQELNEALKRYEPRPIEDAPKGEQFTALIDLGPMVDLWAGQRRYADCCWSYSNQQWVRVVRYLTGKGIRKTVYNRVKDPTHFLPLPSFTSPDPRNEALRVAWEALEDITTMDLNRVDGPRAAREAQAAILKALEGGQC